MRDQLHVADRSEDRATPVVHDARPVLDAAREDLPRSRATLRRVDVLTEALVPLADELPRIAGTTRRVDRLSRVLTDLLPGLAGAAGGPERVERLTRSASRLMLQVLENARSLDQEIGLGPAPRP